MKKLSLKILLLFTSITLTLLSLELFLYIEDYAPNYKKYSYKILNETALLNVDLNQLKKKENINIALGDSFTKGEVCAAKSKDYVSQLNGIQNKNYFNLGLDHGNPIRYIKLLEDLNPKKISSIILMLYYNDINIDKKSCYYYQHYKDKLSFYPKKCDFILNSNKDSSNNTILKKIDNVFELNSNVWLLLRESLVNLPIFKNFYNRSGWEKLYTNNNSEENKAILNDLLFIKNLAKKNNIDLKIVYYPDTNFITQNNSRVKVWRDFLRIASKNNLQIYDPWDFFLQNKIDDNMTWSLTDKHPNCDAHKIMAMYLKTIL